MPYLIPDAKRALWNLNHLHFMVDELRDFAIREEIPDAMTPILHMDRDLRRLAEILQEHGNQRASRESDRVEKWRQRLQEKTDTIGNQ